MKAPRCNHSDTPFFQAVQNRRKSASAASAASALSKINSLGPGVSRPVTSAEHQSASAKHRPASADRALHDSRARVRRSAKLL